MSLNAILNPFPKLGDLTLMIFIHPILIKNYFEQLLYTAPTPINSESNKKYCSNVNSFQNYKFPLRGSRPQGVLQDMCYESFKKPARNCLGPVRKFILSFIATFRSYGGQGKNDFRNFMKS